MNRNIHAAITIVFAAAILSLALPSASAHAPKACSPGYWKNNTDTNGFGDLDSLILREQVLIITSNQKDLGSAAEITLSDAIALKGGGQNAIFRYAAAMVYNYYAFNDLGIGDAFPLGDYLVALHKFLVDGNTSGAIQKFETITAFGCPIDAFGKLV